MVQVNAGNIFLKNIESCVRCRKWVGEEIPFLKKILKNGFEKIGSQHGKRKIKWSLIHTMQYKPVELIATGYYDGQVNVINTELVC